MAEPEATGLLRALTEASRRSPFAARLSSLVESKRDGGVKEAKSPDPSPSRAIPRNNERYAVHTSPLPTLVPPALIPEPARIETEDESEGNNDRSTMNRSRISVDPDGFHSLEVQAKEALDAMSAQKNRIFQSMDTDPSVITTTEDSVDPTPEHHGQNLPLEPDLAPRTAPSIRAPQDRPNYLPHAEYPPITLTVQGTLCTFVPIIEGFDHPYLRGWSGPDHSRSPSTHTYYAVKVGYDPGIYHSFAGAWVRIADFYEHAKTMPEFKGFNSYADATQYLGWDPDDTLHAHTRSRGIRPPCRTISSFPHAGPDPHNWSGYSTSQPSEIAVDRQSSRAGTGSVSSVTGGSVGTEDTPSSKLDALLATSKNVLERLDTNEEVKHEAISEGLLQKLSAKNFPPLKRNPTPIDMGRWRIKMSTLLTNTQWLIDGHSILTMDDAMEDKSDRFTRRLGHLTRILTELLIDDHHTVLSAYASLARRQRGVSLFHKICEHFHPNNDSSALNEYHTFFTRCQGNGESVHDLCRDLQDLYARLSDIGIALEPSILGIQLLHAVLNGAYGQTTAFMSLRTDLVRGRLKLASVDFDQFKEEVDAIMNAAGLCKNGDARRLPASQLARRMQGGAASSSDENPNAWLGQANLDEFSVDALFNWTKCPICRIPRGGRDHHLSQCPRLKERGLVMQYDPDKDEKRKQRAKARKESAASTTVTEANPPHARRVLSENSFAPLADLHVDSTNIKSADSDVYMHTLYDQLLAISAGSGVSCIGTCRRTIPNDVGKSSQLTLVPDSGATSDMFTDRSLFGHDYKPCHGLSVYMGDGSPVPIAGIGTVTFKLEDKIVRLPNALHVPQLDCSLLSITRHGLRGDGCSFIAEAGKIHLTFPSFSLSMPIPNNGDPRFQLEPVPSTGWPYVDFDATNNYDPLDCPNGRRAFLQHIHRGRAMTRSKVHKLLAEKKQFIHLLNGKTTDSKIFSKSFTPEISENINEQELRKDTDKATISVPTQHVVESAAKQVDRYTRYELETLFGGRQLTDYRILEQLGTGIRVTDNDNQVPTVGRLVNRRRGRRQKETNTITHPKSIVGMDICYGPSASPGGFKYVLTLVDKCTTHTWIYGMNGTSSADIQEALWKFFIDINGFPQTIQCDFDPRFLSSKITALLHSHGCRVRAAPPHRQSQNGLVERRWQTIQGMARSLLTAARLPTRFWYWAVREAVTRLNVLPVSSNTKTPYDPKAITTPHEAFYGTLPDYRILFPFGCVGSFRRVRDGTKPRSKFASQGLLGIALGRSEYTNGMIFYNPTLDSFSTSADYFLDRNRTVGEVFPSLQYDGGLTTSAISFTRADNPPKFDIGEAVFVTTESGDVVSGIIETPPTSNSNWYNIRGEDGSLILATLADIHTEYSVPTGKPSTDQAFFTPDWLRQDAKVTYFHNDRHYHGHLSLDSDNYWEFVARRPDGRVSVRVPLPDLTYSWKDRIQQNLLQIGWSDFADSDIIRNRHVSAATLKSPLAPSNLLRGLSPTNPDAAIWRSAYDEEYDGLTGLDTFVEIGEAEYKQLVAKHGEAAMAIPTMNLFTVKKDKDGKPVRAKSRIVVLGNLERRIWDKGDRYAPVINASANRLLVSMAVEDGRILKQGDCKNAFCQPWLPDDEITVVLPPKGCPRSKPGTYWKLKKTLYGLSRSPRHWYQTFSGILKELGFESMPQDPCVFKCTPFADKPPIYLGMYVDDFVYYSKSDDVEQWFEEQLGSRLKVDFMGAVSWFLGCNYDWHRLPDGRITCHISQQAFVEQLLDKFGMTECAGTHRLFRQGLPIDQIDRTETTVSQSKEFVRRYQSLMGGLTWLVTSTRPDINVATSLLSQFNSKPSEGHMQAAKHVLKYLKASSSHGIWFTQGEDRLQGNVGIPLETDTTQLSVFTDANWGPQNASKPKPGVTQMMHLDEMNSVQGYYITRMGGAITWGVQREKRVSGSSCEAEIKAMDEGTKGIQFLRHLCEQLGLKDKNTPIPLYNDNRGSVDWGMHGGVVTKKLRHANIRESRVAEAHRFGEIEICWISGRDNPADLFTKEHKDLAQFVKLRDLMVRPREWIYSESRDDDVPYHTLPTGAGSRNQTSPDATQQGHSQRDSAKTVRFSSTIEELPAVNVAKLTEVSVEELWTSLADLRDPAYMSTIGASMGGVGNIVAPEGRRAHEERKAREESQIGDNLLVTNVMKDLGNIEQQSNTIS